MCMKNKIQGINHSKLRVLLVSFASAQAAVA